LANSVASGLLGDDLLLQACQQQLSFGQGRTQIGDIAEIIAAVDLYEVDALLLTIDPGRHQPHNPSQTTSTPVRELTQKYPSGTRTPNLEAVPRIWRDPADIPRRRRNRPPGGPKAFLVKHEHRHRGLSRA
jgi:hypothetical protein